MVLRPSEQVTDERRIHPENLVVWNEWKTMVFVTHSMELAKSFCTRGIWLCDGVIKMDGPAEEVGDAYLKATT